MSAPIAIIASQNRIADFLTPFKWYLPYPQKQTFPAEGKSLCTSPVTKINFWTLNKIWNISNRRKMHSMSKIHNHSWAFFQKAK
jgi:hypothetical protein